jgi:hypothetical protein
VGGGSKSDSKAVGRLLCSRPKAKRRFEEENKFSLCRTGQTTTTTKKKNDDGVEVRRIRLTLVRNLAIACIKISVTFAENYMY